MEPKTKLTPKQEIILEKYYCDGLKIREIADILGISIGATQMRHHRAVRKLGEKPKRYWRD